MKNETFKIKLGEHYLTGTISKPEIIQQFREEYDVMLVPKNMKQF